MDLKDYKGYKKVTLSDEALSRFYQEGTLPQHTNFEFLENEYLFISDDIDILDTYCYQKGNFRKVSYPTISTTFSGQIKPRNPEQFIAMDMLKDKQSKVKLLKGVYGSGKDLLMLNEALELIEKEIFEKIIFIRPNVTAKGVPDIGYLPGDADEKLAWTLGPFYDKLGGQEGVDYMIKSGKLEAIPLLFIRGRSFENSIVYVTEGQNITSEIAKLIISRIGENSELWINADTHQTDNKIYDIDNGVTKMIERLSGDALFSYVFLPTTERGAVADLANKLDE